jgi:hypothetical protein
MLSYTADSSDQVTLKGDVILASGASMLVMNDRIDYVCVHRDHQGSEPNDAVTMHQDRWAYCPSGAAERHEWRPTGGMSLDHVKRFAGPRPVRSTGQTSD